jgi:hypothetical protein
MEQKFNEIILLFFPMADLMAPTLP